MSDFSSVLCMFLPFNYSRKTHLRAKERYLPYWITQCYLPQTWLNPNQTNRLNVWFTYRGGMEGWVDIGVDYIPRIRDSLPVRRQSPVRAKTIFDNVPSKSNQRSSDRKCHVLTTTLPSQLLCCTKNTRLQQKTWCTVVWSIMYV